MSLRSKILLVLSVVVGVYVIGDHLIQRSVFTRQLAAVEKSRAEQDLDRVKGVLRDQLSNLELRARDWATRPTVVSVALGQGDPALQSDLGSHEIDVLYVCASDGTVAWARSEAPETREPISIRRLPKGSLSPTNPLVKRTEDGASASGLMLTEHGALMLGSHPIFDGETHIGAAILGRFLDDTLVAELGSEMIRVPFTLTPLENPHLPADELPLLDQVTSSPVPVHFMGADGNLHVYDTLRDIGDAPTILLRTTIDPAISRGGKKLVNYAFVSALGTGFLIAFILLRLLSRIVIDPLARLTRSATTIGSTDDVSVRTGIERDDEIGQLSSEFDSMLEKLEESRREVIRTARMAGMSEIATGVLHNVGNVLNSVNVSTNLVTRKTEQLPVADLGAMRDALSEHRDDLGTFVTDDPRGKHLIPFLDELHRSLDQQHQAILTELSGLNRGVEHMGELVRSQQSFAGRAGVLEPTTLDKQFQAALAICSQAGRGIGDVEIVREFEDLGEVEVDRHKLMEILVNLIKNALEAMDEAGTENKRLTLGISEAGDDVARLAVTDSGPGIAEPNVAKVFNHGFTTKSEGHGYGLHVSANAAVEMKGKLQVESDGLGKGATFFLELPVKRNVSAVAA